MNTTAKRITLETLGSAIYVGAPLIPAAFKWDLLFNRDAGTAISACFVLLLIAGLPVLSLVMKNIKVPFKFNWVWVILLAAAYLVEPIIATIKLIGLAGTMGSAVGSAAITYSHKIKDTADRDRLATDIAAKMQGDAK